MTRWLVVFEDSGWSSLRPLTDLLPTPALAFGASHLAARWAEQSGCRWLSCEARAGALAPWRHAPARAAERPAASDLVLVANAAALPEEWLKSILGGKQEALWKADDRIVAAQTTFEKIAPGLGQGERFERFVSDLGLETIASDARLLRWPWQLIEWNEAALLEDLAALKCEQAGEVHRLAAVLEPARVCIERGARVDPLAVLDARPERRSVRWSPGWAPGRTRSPIWTCCGTAGWAGSSPRRTRRRRSGRSCATPATPCTRSRAASPSSPP